MSLRNLNSTKDFFRVWFTWKSQAIIAFASIVGTIMFFSYIWTPTYESTAKLMLLPKTGEGAIISTGKEDMRILPVSMEDMNTEIELLLSDRVMIDTIKSFKGAGGLGLKSPDDTWYAKAAAGLKKTMKETILLLGLKKRLSPFDAKVVLLKNSIEVEPVAASNIILVTLSAEVPKAAAVVLNRLLETYINHHSQVFTKQEGVSFFKEQEDAYNARLDAAESKLKEFQSKWNILDLANQKGAKIALLSTLTEELSNVELEIVSIEEKTIKLKNAFKDTKKELLISKEMRSIPTIVELGKNMVPLLVKRSEIMTSFQANSTERENIQGQIDMLQQEIRSEVKKAIESDELELETLRDKAKFIRQEIERSRAKMNLLSQQEKTINKLTREVQLLKNSYMLYSAKTENAKIHRESLKQDLANVSIADEADVPLEPSFPNRLLMLVISIFVGVFAAIGTPFLLEFLDHSLKMPEDVDDSLSLPVLCTFPLIAGGLNKEDQLIDLRQQVAQFLPKSGLKVFNLTSSRAKEGVSTTLLSLVSVMARNDSQINILLIDANQKHPFLSAEFNLSSKPGLTEALKDKLSCKEAIYRNDDGINVMPCGTASNGEDNVIEQNKFLSLISELKPQYDYIFIDSPPLLVSSESLPLAAAADTTFLIVQAYKTPWEVVQKAKLYLEKNNCHVSGVILNQVRKVIPQRIYGKL